MSRSRSAPRAKNVLVVAAHPDDEILGCGATMAKHKRQGDKVHVLILAQGLTSRSWPQEPTPKDEAYLKHLKAAAQQANKRVGASSVAFAEFPDNRMDSVPLLSVIKRVEASIQTLRPQIVYTHHAMDVNIDHQITNQAVLAACRPQPGHPVKQLLLFEVVSSTHWQVPKRPVFTPTWFNDVSATLRFKLEALRAYKNEMRPWPHARSYRALEALARWRGSTIGIEAAEAFETARIIS